MVTKGILDSLTEVSNGAAKMTTETVLTNDQIIEQFDLHIDNPERFRGYRDFARAIEQAVLNSPQVQFLLTALEESNSLLVACAHEKRPWSEIEAQLGMNRDALTDMGRHDE